MGLLLYDIGLAEAAVETEYYRDSARNRDSLLRSQLDKVMVLHGVRQQDFLKSYDFYKKNPLILKDVVDSLQSRAQRNQQKMFQGGRNRVRPEIRIDSAKP